MAPAGIPAVLCGNPLDKMPPCLHNVFQLFEIGLFSTTNSHLYHYAGNNPVRYVDPDGCQAEACFDIEYFQTQLQLIERSIPELVTVAETVGIVAEQPNILSNLPKLGKAAVVFGIVFFCLTLQGSEISSPLESSKISPEECKKLIAKMEKEIEGIMEKNRGNKASEQYALVATRDGIYPDVRNGTVSMKKGEVWKYGQTYRPLERYSQGYLLSIGVKKETEFVGLPDEVLIVEKLKLYGYYLEHGHLPPGNKIFR